MHDKTLNYRKKFYILAILAILLFAMVSDYIWVRGNDSISGTDSQNHLYYSINFFYDFSDIITQKTFSLWEKLERSIRLLSSPVSDSSFYWPNGLNFTASLFYFLFGTNLLAAKLTLLPYLFILLISTYLIGKTVYTRTAGIVAMFALFMYPLIFESFRQFQLDSPLAAIVTLSILFLLKSECFKKRKYSVFFGIAFGWAMLIKGQAALFIIWPLLLVLYKAVIPQKKDTSSESSKKGQFVNIGISILLTSLIASIWWWNQGVGIIPGIKEHIFARSKAVESWWDFDKKYSIDSTSYHLKKLYLSLGSLYFLLFMISFIAFIKRYLRYKGILLAWMLCPFFLFSFVFTIKHPRFLMPGLPAMAIVSAWGLLQIKNTRLRIFLISFTVLFSFMQFYMLYDIDKWKISKDKKDMIFGHTYYRSSNYFTMPNKEVSKVVDVMYEAKNKTDVVKVGFIDCGGGRPETLEILFWSRIANRFTYPYEFIQTAERFLDNFQDMDFIILTLPTDYKVDFSTIRSNDVVRLLKDSHGQSITGIETNSPKMWGSLLRLLKEIDEEFLIKDSIVGLEKNYYVYKKKTSHLKNKA